MTWNLLKGGLLLCLLYPMHHCLGQQRDLDFFVQTALQRSPLLKDLDRQAATIYLDSLQLRAGLRPQLTAGSYSNYAPVVKGWGYDPVITNYQTFSAQAMVSQKLVGKDNLANQLAAFDIQRERLHNQAGISRQDVTSNITRQYIIVYGDGEQIAFTKELVSTLMQEEAVLKKLVEQGIYLQADFLAFVVNRRQQELRLQQLQLQYQDDFAQLCYITGIEADTTSSIPRPVLDTAANMPAFDATVFDQSFKIDSLSTIIADKQIDFDYKPRLSLYADGGYYSSFYATPYKNFGFSAGINLTVPIYDGGQKKMQHQKNALTRETVSDYRHFQHTQYNQQVTRLLNQLNGTNALIRQTAEQLYYAKGLLEARQRLLVTGDIRVADYIMAVENYLTAKYQNTQNQVQKMQLLNQLNYWNAKP